jgi:hypothetical protein
MTNLLLDIDGVIIPTRNRDPFGHFRVSDWQGETRMISEAMRSLVIRLFNNFNVTWFSAWNERAKDLEKGLVLPNRNFLDFDLSQNRPAGNLAEKTLKLPTAIKNFSDNRPLIWVDDDFKDDARAWQEERLGPALLIEVDEFIGLTDKDIQAALEFKEQIRRL